MRQHGSLRGAQLERQTAAVGVGVATVASLLLLYAYRRHRTRSPYSLLEWQEAVQPSGTILKFSSIARAISRQGLDPSLRAELWPFLLDVFSPESSCEQRQQQHMVMVEQYQSLLLQCQAYDAAMQEHLAAVKLGEPSPPSGRTSPLQQQQQQQQHPQQPQHPQQQQQRLQPPQAVVQFREAHRIIVIDAVRTDFRKHSIAGVLSSSSRQGQGRYHHHHNSSSNSSLAHQHSSSSSSSLHTMHFTDAVSSAAARMPWLHRWLGLPEQGPGDGASPMWVSLVTQQVLDASHHLTQELKQQVVRMVAILSAYAVHDPTTGYCQGMSDLLLPLLVLFEDDALAFWCFAAIMQTVNLRRNFAVDESGIFGQLRSLSAVLGAADATVAHKLRTIGAAECHFAYRMIVVLMRRDLPLHQVVALWDVLWADDWCCRHLWHATAGRSASPLPPTASAPGAGAAAAERVQHQGPTSPEECTEPAASNGSAPAAAAAMAAAAQVGEPTLFTCFVAAVVLSQKRRILEECRDADDMMRLFHSLRFIDFPACLHKAHQLRDLCGAKLR